MNSSHCNVLLLSAMAAFSAGGACEPPRLMALGDSITRGARSTHEGGWRKLFHQMTDTAGAPVNMVGHREDGDFADNQHEGESSAPCSALANRIVDRLNADPTSRVLLMCGINDLGLGATPEEALDNLELVLDEIDAWAESSGWSPIVHVASLLNVRDVDDFLVPLLEAFNVGLPDRLAGRTNVVHVQCFEDLLPPQLFADRVHSNDEGYDVMAICWYDAVFGVR